MGDPKQSIYRFRRADMAIYAAERARVLEAGGVLARLTENRRSRAVVVDWVNAVMGALLGEVDDPTVQAPYVPILAERGDDLRRPGRGLDGRVVGRARLGGAPHRGRRRGGHLPGRGRGGLAGAGARRRDPAGARCGTWPC